MSVAGESESERLEVQVHLGPETEDEEVAEATLALRRELLELDVDSVELGRAGEPPPGTRAVDFVALGTLVVGLANSKLLEVVLGTLRSWLRRNPRGSITLQLDGDVLALTGISSEEQRRLADAWLRRHGRR